MDTTFAGLQYLVADHAWRIARVAAKAIVPYLTVEVAKQIVQDDEMIYDLYRFPDLSGEWADGYSYQDLKREVYAEAKANGVAKSDVQIEIVADYLANVWEETVRKTLHEEILYAARKLSAYEDRRKMQSLAAHW